jgi:hypothetical protein
MRPLASRDSPPPIIAVTSQSRPQPAALDIPNPACSPRGILKRRHTSCVHRWLFIPLPAHQVQTGLHGSRARTTRRRFLGTLTRTSKRRARLARSRPAKNYACARDCAPHIADVMMISADDSSPCRPFAAGPTPANAAAKRRMRDRARSHLALGRTASTAKIRCGDTIIRRASARSLPLAEV